METDANTPQPSHEATAGTAKKYIRTLEGDMATLKKGGTPELAPFTASPSPSERLVAASPITLPQTTPNAEPIPPPALVPPLQPAGSSPIQTYASDFSDRMKETNASTATVLAAEQDATLQTYQPPKPKASLTDKLYILAGILLLIASGVGGYFAYMSYATTIEPIILAPVISAPIFVDDREQISGTGTVLLQEIEQSVGRPLASGAVRLLYTMDATGSTSSPQATTGNNIFPALKVSAPDILLRNLNAVGSMAGVINVADNQSPFFILSVISYSDTFSGMLSWEEEMLRDLSALFPPYPIPIQATSTVATTTPKVKTKVATTTVATTTPTIALGFRDEVVSNHDVRVYRDAKGRSLLLYGYWNQATLVIARDLPAFIEILQRLATSRAQ
ncbi:MAG: hypothetical protein Q8O94_03405 [bacterium]|nr:hypothetical protein [bacterium]